MASKRLSKIITAAAHPDDKPPFPSPLPPDGGSPNVSPSDVSRGRLRKPQPGSATHSRSASLQAPPVPQDASQPSLRELQSDLAAHAAAPGPLLLPPALGGSGYSSRNSSMERPSSRSGTPAALNSRPSTPNLSVPRPPLPPTPASANNMDRKERKKSWFGGGGRSKRDRHEERGPTAWIAGHPQKLPYDTEALLDGMPMTELWDEEAGDCFVHLFPRAADKGPSFKINAAVFASSRPLTRMAFGGHGRRPRPPTLEERTIGLALHHPSTPPATPERNGDTTTDATGSPPDATATAAAETHLYLPVMLSGDMPAPAPATNTAPSTKGGNKHDHPPDSPRDAGMDDLQTLLDVRNFFAFLCGQSLVATERRHSFFHIFTSIAGVLANYEFADDADGSTLGEVASASFDNYVEELGLADVRASREKTIEGVVLGERMKSVRLYNEAFTHAAGKHDDLLAMKSAKFAMIGPVTQNRLIRAAMDLDKRIASVRLILHSFDFPALFTGIMASRTSEERREGVRFDAWKEAFLGFRKNVMSLYKHRYGDWPPKASSKKNSLETSGLNRLVLRDVYRDMSAVYDLLVDRTHLTTRSTDGIDLAADREEPTVRGLRAVLSEYDRSSPPVKPPVPFDLPRLPTLRATRSDFGTGDKRKDLKTIQKKLKDDEVARLLNASSNEDLGDDEDDGGNNGGNNGGSAGNNGDHHHQQQQQQKQQQQQQRRPASSPFIDAFREMERRAGHNCSIAELVDLRIGQWIFVYSVLQALPMLACDAPGLKWTHGVEYFLCEPPRSGAPWASHHHAQHHPASGSAAAGGRRTWFSVGDGGGVVSLPTDVVEHGVEGIYHRSHCWVMAERWLRLLEPAPHEHQHQHLDDPSAAAAAAAAFDPTLLPQPPHTESFAPFLSPSLGTSTPPPPPSPYISQEQQIQQQQQPTPTHSRPVSPTLAPAPAFRTSGGRASSFAFGLEALSPGTTIAPRDGSRSASPAPALLGMGIAGPGPGADLGPGIERPRSAAHAHAHAHAHTHVHAPVHTHAVDKAKTFDAILAGVAEADQRRGKRK